MTSPVRLAPPGPRNSSFRLCIRDRRWRGDPNENASISGAKSCGSAGGDYRGTNPECADDRPPNVHLPRSEAAEGCPIETGGVVAHDDHHRSTAAGGSRRGCRGPDPAQSVPGPLLFVGRGGAHPVEQRQGANRHRDTGAYRADRDLRAPDRSAFADGHHVPAVPESTGRNWFGTTGNGQDVFSQLVYGARVSCWSASPRASSRRLVAVTIGLIAGYRPGVIDEVLSFVTNLTLVIRASR